MSNVQILWCLLFASSFHSSIAQTDQDNMSYDIHVKMYFCAWERYYSIARLNTNIQELHSFYFESHMSDVMHQFDDYEDCVEKLHSQDTIQVLSNNKKILVNVLVELSFGEERVDLYFLRTGDYLLDNIVYKRNSGLYFSLFKYFSNELIPEDILLKSKEAMVDIYWRNE